MNVTLPIQDTNVNKFASTKTTATVVLARKVIALKAMARTVQVTAIDICKGNIPPSNMQHCLCISQLKFHTSEHGLQYLQLI